MSNILSNNLTISTAAYCLWNIPIQEKLENSLKLGFKNVQIALSTLKMIRDFEARLDYIPQIMEFEDVSLHAPWCGIKYGDNKKTIEVLETLKSINKYIPFSRYVFNYDSILDVNVLYNSGLNIMIRNPVKPGSWHSYCAVIQKNSLLSAFDLNKAARNTYPVDNMINELQESVAEIHISGFASKKNRMPVVSTKQEYLLKYLNGFNTKEIPVIIEGLFSPNDLHSIIEEKKLIMNHNYSKPQ